MHHGRDSSLPSIISGSFNDSCSVASSESPRTSLINSPYDTPSGSPKESLNGQFSTRMSLQPPSSNQVNKSNNNGSNTFVHKLYNMVVDSQYQHLIAWNYTGSSFIVCNIMEFSRDVLPKHFKHNNFSSFVRQLNMYGFHKVNKSPRGHRTLAENQIWEFSHSKFIKDRPDLLDEIKRKSLENESSRRDNVDINSHMAMMQVSHSEIAQQLARLQDNFTQVVRELAETKNTQNRQQQLLRNMMDFLSQQKQGSQLQQQLPAELSMDQYNNSSQTIEETSTILERPPSIYITSHDTALPSQSHPHHNFYLQQQQHNNHTNSNNTNSSRIPPALTVQTHNLSQEQLTISTGLSPMDQQASSPALSAYHTALNTPVSSNAASPFISDDDIPSLYSPHSPITPNAFTLNDTSFQSNFYTAQPSVQQHQQQQQQHHHHHSHHHHQQQQLQPDNNTINDMVMMDQHSVGAAYNSFALGVHQRTG